MGKKYAVIDVGSNSVRLLLAEKCGNTWLPLEKKLNTTRLLEGVQNGVLAASAIERTADAIIEYVRMAQAAGAEKIAAFGTSAMRDAENRALLIRAVEKAVALRVISGEEEAALAYAGAGGDGRRGVLDIGGGSTEMLAGADGRVLASGSARIGAVRLKAMAEGNFSPDILLAQAKSVLTPVYAQVGVVPVDGWTGVGGTITSLAAMEQRLAVYRAESVQGFVLRAGQARVWLDRLSGMTLTERRGIQGLSSARADVIDCGTAILCAFFALSGISELLVSDADNLLGYIRTVMC